MDRRLISIALCAGLGAIVGVATGDILHASHTAGQVLAALGAGIGAIIGGCIARRYAA